MSSTPDSKPRPSVWRTIRDALAGRQQDYTKGPLSRAIGLLAIPMVLETAMESLFMICDLYWVSDLGDKAVAAVGLTESMLTLYYAIAIGLMMATTATVARRIGEKDEEGASQAGQQAILLGIALGVVTGIPLWFFGPELLGLMGADAATIEIGGGYTSTMLAFNVVILLLFLNNAIFRGAGDPALAMRALWLANGINIVLDPCLIYGWGPFPELGVTGAAVATTCGRSIGVAYQFWELRRGSSRVVLRGAATRIDFSVMAGILRLSLGGIGQMIIATTSWIALMRIVSPFGSAAVAGYTIAVRILIFTILPSWGLSNAAATLVGQSLGARDPDRAERAAWLTGLYNMIFLTAVMVVFLAFGPVFVGIFTEDADVMAVGVESLRIITYGYPMYAWAMVMAQSFNGAGDTATPTWMNLICFWMLQVPLAYVMAKSLEWGPSGVFWSVAIAESVLAILSIAVFRRGRWKQRHV